MNPAGLARCRDENTGRKGTQCSRQMCHARQQGQAEADQQCREYLQFTVFLYELLERQMQCLPGERPDQYCNDHDGPEYLGAEFTPAERLIPRAGRQ